MFRVVGFILLIIVVYTIIKAKNGGVDPFFPSDGDKSHTIEGNKKPEVIPEGKIPEMEGNFIERTLSKVLINVFKTEKGRLVLEKMIQPMNNPVTDENYSIKINSQDMLHASFHIKTINEGRGASAICGHMVNVTYKVINMQNLIVESGDKNIRLGQASIFKGLDNVVLGMKIGEKRSALLGQQFAYEAADFNGKKPANPTSDYRLEVQLNNIISKISIDNSIKIFDDEIALRMPVLCGDKVSFDVKISNLNGEVVFDSTESGKKMEFMLGDINYPVIFSYGLMNKQDKGIRTVISKGEYFSSFTQQVIKDIHYKLPIDVNQFYIIEFSKVQKI